MTLPKSSTRHCRKRLPLVQKLAPTWVPDLAPLAVPEVAPLGVPEVAHLPLFSSPCFLPPVFYSPRWLWKLCKTRGIGGIRCAPSSLRSSARRPRFVDVRIPKHQSRFATNKRLPKEFLGETSGNGGEQAAFLKREDFLENFSN